MLNNFSELITWIVEKIAMFACLLIVIIMFFVSYEVVSRYCFNHPTSWVWIVSRQLFGIFILVAGSYTMIEKSHIRIEMIYERFSPVMKMSVEILSFIAFAIFMLTLAWKGAEMGWESLKNWERATGAFPLPLYPLKILIPVGALLFLCSGFAVFVKTISKRR